MRTFVGAKPTFGTAFRCAWLAAGRKSQVGCPIREDTLAGHRIDDVLPAAPDRESDHVGVHVHAEALGGQRCLRAREIDRGLPDSEAGHTLNVLVTSTV